MKSVPHFSALVVTLLLAASIPASVAVPIPLGNAFRTATLDSATAGAIGTGNTQASTIDTHFPGLAPWTIRGDVNAGSGLSDGLLTIAFDSGDWDQNAAEGRWFINPTFWSLYANAVIAMHVGNGNEDPDHFAWLIEVGETSGTFSYERLSGGGGGFSNMHLFSSGTAVRTPDSGSTIALLGLSLIAFGFLRKRLSK